MSKTAIYPGTFDPITFGHIDVIKKSLKLFDKVVIAVSDGENKNYLFDAEERIEIVKGPSSTLYGSNDSLYWREFHKYDNSGKIIKKIRYSPEHAINPEMFGENYDDEKLIWAESYNFNSLGNSFEIKELNLN